MISYDLYVENKVPNRLFIYTHYYIMYIELSNIKYNLYSIFQIIFCITLYF